MAAVSNSILNEKVVLEILGDTWVQIKNSEDRILISKLMKQNERFLLEANVDYTITTGNAGNIQLLINNKVIRKLGKSGEILNSYKIIANSINND